MIISVTNRGRANWYLRQRRDSRLQLSLATLLGIAAASSLAALPAQAQSARSYVSGAGTDSTSCSASAPCLTLRAALTATAPGGEIYVLNSANYGAVTIDKSVTITSEGAIAGIVAPSGVGITISVGASDVVNLRGLDIDGGGTGISGIQFTSGQALVIQKSVVRGFIGTGISFAPGGTGSVLISDTVVSNNGGSGILLAGSGTSGAALSRITAIGNGVGILAWGSNTSITMTDVVAFNNNYGIGASASAVVMVRNSTVSSNATGILADQSSVVRVDRTTVTANGTGWQATNGGQLQSFGNNNASGNSTDGTPTTTVVLQ